MSAAKTDSRGVCQVCARIVHRRLDGALRKHRDTRGRPCEGSETEPAVSRNPHLAPLAQLLYERPDLSDVSVAVRVSLAVSAA